MRFGISGLPPEGVEDEAFLDGLVAQGHTAIELGFTKDFPWKEARCEAFGALAVARGVAVSLHAPYFAVLTSEDEDKAKQCMSAIHNSIKLGAALGSSIICAHIGHHGKREPAETLDLVRHRLEALAPRVEQLGVYLGFENSGNDTNFGSIGDIGLLSHEFPFVAPVIDWAHAHAATRGALTSVEAFDQVLGFVLDSFPESKISPLQCQFSDNEIGPHGEIRHLPYGEGTLRIAPFMEAAWEKGVELVVISESRDSESHQKIFDEAQSALADKTEQGSVVASNIESPRPVRATKVADRWQLERVARPLTVSNINKEMFPGQFTKGDVISYYSSVAPYLVAHLAGRPISMNRFPDGIAGNSFYEKRAPGHQPSWMDTATVDSESMGGSIEFLLASNRESILWFANMGCLEFHPFHARADDHDHPDYAVFDLDPHAGATWEQVIDTARLLETLLTQLGLRSYPKVSGSKGVHVYVPVDRVHTQAEVREFVHAVGTLMAAANPTDITMEFDKPKRGNRVFVDAFRNSTGQTVASVYSIRPLQGAPVSTPILWDELDDIHNGDITIANIWPRLERHGDLFAPVVRGGQDLEVASEALGIER